MRRHALALLLSLVPLAAACVTAGSARPARVQRGLSLDGSWAVQALHPSASCVAALGFPGCEAPLALPSANVGAGLGLGWTQLSLEFPVVLLRRMPVLDVYQQLWDGRTAWGIGAAAGHDPGQQQYLRGEIRVQRPLASGADLLLTPSVTDMRELDGSAKRARVTTAGLAVGRTVGGSQFRAVPSAFFGMTRAEGIDGSIVGSGRPYGPTLSGTVAFSVRVIWAPLRSR